MPNFDDVTYRNQYLCFTVTVNGKILAYQLKADDEGLVLDAIYKDNDRPEDGEQVQSACWVEYADHPDSATDAEDK